MRKFLLFVNLFLLLPVAQNAFAQRALERGYRTLSEEQARNYVGFLADDLLCGREAGCEGGYIAARYIISLLKEWGIASFDNCSYTQSFDAYEVENENGIRWRLAPDSTVLSVRRLNNILAVIPGKNRDEYVVVGAHYDHLGIGCAVDGDSCFNGADDNASGVSAVLQIAKAIKMSGKQPERSIVFAFWDGEEKGLLGSTCFVQNWQEKEKIKAYVNFDMVGRGPVGNPSYLKYFYTSSHPQFGDWLREDMRRRGFCFTPDYVSWDKPYSGSDNAPFARAGIPIVWYHTEGHPDYHAPGDSAGKIDYSKLLDITRAAYLCVWRMANE
ncbi:MAG: M20/M25/M40 family metallo-hydrolase [Bacteroidaceae bacterium]|nr:M20/M25/M40 family metallo-hydrolase [Bacteroidaceae bacterium]